MRHPVLPHPRTAGRRTYDFEQRLRIGAGADAECQRLGGGGDMHAGEQLVDHLHGAADAGFVTPIAATIFIFVLLANWLDFFPLTKPVEPAAADINLTLAMAIAVIVIVQWYSIHVLGFRGYLRRFTKPSPIRQRTASVRRSDRA